MKQKNNNIQKKQNNVNSILKAIKKKMDHREFLRYYMLNKNGEWVKRNFGGNHRPKPGSNRHKNKLAHMHK